MQSIALRLEECGLMMHPEKSKIVYCKDSNRTKVYSQVQFTFLGFTFRPRKAINRQGRIYAGFLPSASDEALKRMRKVVHGWKLHRQTPANLAELAEHYNPIIRGWWQYYGAFYRRSMYRLFQYIDLKLKQWARRKYKTLCRHGRRSAEWLSKMKKVCPQIFSHWNVIGGTVG